MAKSTTPTVDEILVQNKMGTAAESVDKVFQTTPVGQISTAIGDSFFGLNHRQQPAAISINKDYYGLTFFTRPRLNLTSDNIRAVRQLAPLLTNNKDSLQRIIRCLLDPEGAKTGVTSQFVDSQQAFIPILTNHLLSISGWPDVVAPTFTSQEGVYKEAFSMVDGLTQNYSTYDISANFRNLPGDPINALFFAWIHYASSVFEGKMVPYPDSLINNEIDYNTRIYRVVLDQTKSRVQKIGACGAAFPTNSPMGAAFNYASDRPLNNENDQITIHFQCMGAMYQDTILIDEFNRTVVMFNSTMDGSDAERRRYYTKVPMDALEFFNNRGYPRINPDTYELEWWVSNEDYQSRLSVYTSQKEMKALQNG